MLNCFVIDDELPAIDVLEKYVKKIGLLNLIGSTTDPVEGIKVISEKKVDVVFLDIEMDHLSGMDVKRAIDPLIQVIFCTAHSEFAVESYEINAVDYLLKPISFERFTKAIGKLQHASLAASFHNHIPLKNDYIFVQVGGKGKMVKVNLADILYIESKKNFIQFHLDNGRTILLNSTMKNIEDQLGSRSFIRTHNSFIVSFEKVSEFEKNIVRLKGSEVLIPLGAVYKGHFMERIRNDIPDKYKHDS